MNALFVSSREGLMRVSTCFALPCFFLAGALLLSGCSADFGHSANSSTQVTAQFKGVIHGGQQPIAGAHVFLFAANPGGYGQSSINLLTTGDGSDPDYGNYFLTAADGSFNLNSNFTCPAGNPVTYLLAMQGNPGMGIGTNNTAISLMAALGPCSSLSSIPFVSINEVTTVGAAYAFGGYMTDATHLSSSGTALALTGLTNAAANAGNLADLATGQAYATTPGSSSGGVTGTVPAATLNTLANILASCVNTNGSTASGDPCGTLFSLATADGTATGAVPSETATAMLNLAHHPVATAPNIAALFVLNTSIAPFSPSLTVAPSTWVVGINYNNASGGFSGQGYEPQAVAIDAAGNAWVVNSAGNSVTEITTPGASANSFNYSGGHISHPASIAIDSAGNAWVANVSGNTVTEIIGSGAGASYFTSYGGASPLAPYGFGGTPLSLSIDGTDNVWVVGGNVTEITGSGAGASYAFYTAGGLSAPEGIAIDGAGNAWVTTNLGDSSSSVTEITVSGTTPSYSHYSNIGSYPIGIAIDAANNVWIPDQVNNSVTEIMGSGPGSGRTTYSGGGPNWHPTGPAIDGAGNVWVADLGSSVSEIAGSGASASYTYYSFGGISSASSVAIDGSGDVWTANTNNTVTELMGVATPVVTPITAGSKTVPGKLGVRP
jgi:hypothetical protein